MIQNGRQMISNQTYTTVWNKFQNGQVSIVYWQKFCRVLLKSQIRQNRDVFIRLKFR